MNARPASELSVLSSPAMFGDQVLTLVPCPSLEYTAPLDRVRAALLASAPQLSVKPYCTPWEAWPYGPDEVQFSIVFNREGLPMLDLTMSLLLAERDGVSTVMLRGHHPTPPAIFLELQTLLDAQFQIA